MIILVAQKTLMGDWRKISDSSNDFDPSAVTAKFLVRPISDNRPDDSKYSISYFVGMNSVIQAAIEEPRDVDQFKIESPRPWQEEGFLRMKITRRKSGSWVSRWRWSSPPGDGLLASSTANDTI